jgi:probable DNA repair protein
LTIVGADTPIGEADAAANWCACFLMRDPKARLLVVVPGLGEQRHLWERAFSQHLDPGLILGGSALNGESNFAIEGGRALISYRLVNAALHLIALTTGSGAFNELSEVLRSPYQTAFPRSSGHAIDRWLRERNSASGRPALLRVALLRLGEDLGETIAASMRAFLALLDAPSSKSSATPADWAQAWVALLKDCGWPGATPLSSDEQQQRMRFDELLGDFAAVTVPAHRLSLSEAAARLRAMAERVSFEPASEDVPITISSRLEDPIVRYDGLWVAGLSADAWPPPARPDPLLPLPMQRSCGMPFASAAGQSMLARRLQHQWQRSARHAVLSWSKSSEDLPRDRSPLLEADAARSAAAAHRPEDLDAALSLERWQSAQAPVLEAWQEQTTPMPAVDGVLQGGTRLLELQSQCPFRAFAELRLNATALEQPSLGIHPRVRGMILHQALQLFWGAMHDQETLAHSSAERREQVIEDSVSRAMRETMEREPGSASQQVRRREHVRTAKLIWLLIEWELRRRWFSTRKLESDHRYQFGGAALNLRLDRVDQLDDGLLLVIDYKSGARKTFNGLADRLQQPQLPAYALAAGKDLAPVGAVATLYLGRGGVKISGCADGSRRLSYLNGPKPGEPGWAERTARWEQQLRALVEEFLRGDASVHPQQDACKFCHLHSLCRIDAVRLAALDTDPDKPEDDDSDDESEEESE